jgi:hypothetical protein
MAGEKKFWETVPGILTGIAAIITAVGGVIAIYYNVQPRPSTTPQQRVGRPSSPTAPSDKDSLGAQVASAINCSPTFPEIGQPSGGRVLYFDADESARGAAVYLNGKCQGYLANQSSGRLRDNMLVNVPPGTYEITLTKKGYRDFQSTITVPPSVMPDAVTPKVAVKVNLVPST